MILIVDDKKENIFSLKSVLELNGFATDAAHSGEEALKKILKIDYSLIILDVQMPGMDGFEVAEAITGFRKTSDIPIIFLSAVNTHKKFITRGFESGAIDYITKPVDPDILILKVRNFQKLFEKTKALQEAEKALTTTVKELQSTLESIPQIAFTARPDGSIDTVNQQWFRYADSEGQFPPSHPDDPVLQQQWMEAIQKNKPVTFEVRCCEKNTNEYRYFLLRATPVIVNDTITKWVGTFTDIHHQKMMNEELEQRVAERTNELLTINRELEISNHDLQQFASVASHDLKEPLRKIQFFGNMMKERMELANEDHKYLDKIIQSSHRMSSLISDLLNFARLSEPDVFELTDLNKVISEILPDLELIISEKNAVFHIDQLPALEVAPGLIRQLFQNIISNALKFSKKDMPPVIHVRSFFVNDLSFDAPGKTKGKFCRIEIEDNGIGFDEKYLEKIFTLFQRLYTREEYEGTGIGLAIAKKIVEKHDGLITAKSQPGSGTEFIIILPVRHIVRGERSAPGLELEKADH
jgi:signal transduction histidine kinase/FixJ family two-component response regulator